ncbi:hypothetical protein [Paracraurococcus ruber]|uniref:Uncharacterized protein n=1 Tax=Paracraurococcus ruber TaxID=77675 RepID=A0ABS1D0V2_9PROT|nr:hypothetical protein [Paracraurococcus ruber]MBK1660419.1 hypothetical protein [Paracraurococcus ruber]TDG27591.1 hypothetical protein E2C05_22340 [Paracraurococcus ruber]
MTPTEVERIKLTANAIDRASTATLNAGVILPLAGLSLLPGRISLVDVLATAYIWGTVALALHLAARRLLRSLDP